MSSTETLEEAADNWVFNVNGSKWSNNDDTAGDNFGSFKAGAEWQAERSYSEEEMRGLIIKFWEQFPDQWDIDTWINENKKK